MKLTASDGSTNDNFGSSIAFDGNTALIGAAGDGSMYIFRAKSVPPSQILGSLVIQDYDPNRYADFSCDSSVGACVAPCYEYGPFLSLESNSKALQTSLSTTLSDTCDLNGYSAKDGSKYCTNDLAKAASYFECMKTSIGASTLCAFAKSNSPFTCTAPCYEYVPFVNGVSLDPTVAASNPDNTCDVSGYSVKDNSKFCTTSNSTILDYFDCRAKKIGIESICEFAKSNAPYECRRKVAMPPLQQLSLAYANTLIIYSAIASIFAGYMYRKSAKSDHTDDTKSDIWKSLQKSFSLLVPDGFYQIKRMPFIGSVESTAVLTFFLYCLSGVAFSFLIYYYGSDSQGTIESIVTSKWNLTGYTSCEPLQGDSRYGLQNTYQSCLLETSLSNLSTSNMIAIAETKSIQRNEYDLAGFVCKPMQNDVNYGVDVSFSECKDFLSSRVVDQSDLIAPYTGVPELNHFQQFLKVKNPDIIAEGSNINPFGSLGALHGGTLFAKGWNLDTGDDVYVFSCTGTFEDFTWNFTMKLTTSIGSQFYVGYGSAIAFSGNTVLIGARGSGSVYAFTRTDANDDSTWTQTMKLTASDGSIE